MHTEQKTSKSISILMVLAAASMWGCIGIFVHRLNDYGLSSFQMAFMRCFTCVILMLFYLLIMDRSKLKIDKKDLGWFALNGLVSIFIMYSSYPLAVLATNMSTAVILLYTAPAFVMLFSVLFFHEKLTGRKMICLFLCVLGSALVSGLIGGIVLKPTGLFFGLLSGISYALYSIFSAIILKKYHPFTNIVYSFGFASIACFLVSKPGELVQIFSGTPQALFWAVANGLVTCFISYLIYTMALTRIRPSTASIIATIEPVVATVVGVLLYQETLTLSGIAGIIMVLAALILQNLPAGRIRRHGRGNGVEQNKNRC